MTPQQAQDAHLEREQSILARSATFPVQRFSVARAYLGEAPSEIDHSPGCCAVRPIKLVQLVAVQDEVPMRC